MNYNILTLALGLLVSMLSCSKSTPNQEEWVPLFNGKDFSDWKIKFAGHPLGKNPRNTFIAKGNTISVNYSEYKTFDNLYGHMYYKTPFSHYKIKFEYRFTGKVVPGGEVWNNRNSGIMLHSQSPESNELNQKFPISIELQLLGGLNDNKPRTTGNVCTPGTIVKMADTLNYKHCINSKSKTYFGDQWVHAEAIVAGGESMAFIIENDTVLNFTQSILHDGIPVNDSLWQKKYWENLGISETKDHWLSKKGQILDNGYIALQAESHAIDFKNIQLLNLCGCKDKSAKNYKSYFLKHNSSKCIY